MDTVAGCDLPISWAFPAVSGLAGMRWFTLLPCCLPRTHGQLPASCLPLCVLALPSRQLPGYGCQKSSFLQKGQVTSSHLCQYLCFLLILLCSSERKLYNWMLSEKPRVTSDLLDLNLTHPWASPGGCFYSSSGHSPVVCDRVQKGSGRIWMQLLLRIPSLLVIFGQSLMCCMAGREKRRDRFWLKAYIFFLKDLIVANLPAFLFGICE